MNDNDIKQKLTPEEYHVLREKGTEAPFSGKLVNEKREGMYACKVCGTELFTSDTKFESGTGWPSFTDPANLENVTLLEDLSYGMIRTEVQCKHCGSHLGHVFPVGPGEKGSHYCINSACLNFIPTNNEEQRQG